MRSLVLLGCLSAAMASVAQTSTPSTVVVRPGAGSVTKSGDRPQGISSPVPALFKSAHKVFLSNHGADAGLFPHPFTGTQDRGYGYFRKLLQADTQVELVDNPAEADLVLDLRLSAPSSSLGGDKQHGTADVLPVFQLIIYDRPSHYVLWAISQTIDKANLQSTHDKNFDDALNLLQHQIDAVFIAARTL